MFNYSDAFFIEKQIYAVLILLVAIAGVGFNIHKMESSKTSNPSKI